ncbi:FUSC family protein [Acidisoma cellulosilytica]|uniref:FUSC family protein n=1 Tax=Acidisoma cellulosilyticum TaxID=2802395 RepID=A0A964E2X4_9PROT|nr:FUSC family protein [Acidisoma cellulosilyticum]MCB8879764.1 FUSC family protein [Acidisoma cellulosilyticum]
MPDPAPNRILRALRDPRLRYRHGRLIHALRCALGIFLGLGITYSAHIPNGEWTSISFLIVMVGLQHHGNIRRRAVERAAGTLLGAAAGLVIIGMQSTIGITPLTFMVMALFCGACGYHAISRGGYVAQLSAITLMIVAGYGLDPITVGLWRTVNVLIGIVIALALSFALPIYARDYWRFGMADALRRCAELILPAKADDQTQPRASVETISPVLNRLRPLMPPVARETKLPMAQLESIQRSLRLFLSLLELATSPEPAAHGALPGTTDWNLADAEAERLAARLIAVAEGLETGAWALPWSAPVASESLAARMTGAELQSLRRHLLAAPPLWSV